MDQRRTNYEAQIDALKRRLATEEDARGRLEEELQRRTQQKSVNEVSVASEACNEIFDQRIVELREEFERELRRLRDSHRAELEEEKQATRQILNVQV